MREVFFYKDITGKCPVEAFLDHLSGKQAQKIIWVMRLVEELDIILKQYFKKLVNTDDIWEIRVIASGDIFRVLGFFLSDNYFVATNGFHKKTQKTPKGEIALAEKYKLDYLKRKLL